LKQHSSKAVALFSALVLGTSMSARATVELQFQWGGTLYESGFSGQYVQSADAVGIYAFSTVGSNPAIDPPQNILYSVCLSPAGLLDSNQHTYNELPFATANPGIFPSQWQSGVINGKTQYWGIQNAAYLWSTFGMNIVNGHGAAMGLSGNSSEQAAALEFAI
jgi:hypothetical protein